MRCKDKGLKSKDDREVIAIELKILRVCCRADEIKPRRFTLLYRGYGLEKFTTPSVNNFVMERFLSLPL